MDQVCINLHLSQWNTITITVCFERISKSVYFSLLLTVRLYLNYYGTHFIYFHLLCCLKHCVRSALSTCKLSFSWWLITWLVAGKTAFTERMRRSVHRCLVDVIQRWHRAVIVFVIADMWYVILWPRCTGFIAHYRGFAVRSSWYYIHIDVVVVISSQQPDLPVTNHVFEWRRSSQLLLRHVSRLYKCAIHRARW